MTFFNIGRYSEVADLVERYHYSRRVPSNVQLVGSLHEDGGLFGEHGPVVAGCFMSIPPARWSEVVLELSRLVRHPDAVVPLTGLIAKTCDEARRRGWHLIVSYADWTHHHHGGIYQAASWSYAGQKSRMDGLIVDGRFVTGRGANHKWGTQSPGKLRAMLPGHTIEGHYDDGKHLYFRALTRKGQGMASRLGLTPHPYPKPDPSHSHGQRVPPNAQSAVS